MKDQYIEVNDINTRYWSMGQSESVIVMIHGLGGYVENWELNVESLAQQHQVYALDMVGFGRSDKSQAVSYSIRYLAQFVSAFMRTMEIETATLLGHSMGGAVALQLALLEPDMVSRLVLVNSGGLGSEVSGVFRMLSIPVLGNLLMRPSKRAIERGLKAAFFDENLVTPDRVERGFQMASLPDLKQTVLKAIRTSVNLKGAKSEVLDPIFDNLEQINVPTLVIWGKQDTAVPLSHVDVATSRMPNCRSYIFDQCKHWPQIEHADKFNEVVLEFLAG